MKRITLIIFLEVIASVASAQTNTLQDTTRLGLHIGESLPVQTKATQNAGVFGFHLGEKLSVPECIRMKKSTLYSQTDITPCYERLLSDFSKEDKAKWAVPVVSETLFIRFPFEQKPPIAANQKIVAQVVEG